MSDQSIATLARDLVERQIQNIPGHEKETAYRSLCEGLPILLRTAGLRRTVTFLDAKKKLTTDQQPDNEYAFVLDHLGQQLRAAKLMTSPHGRELDLLRLVISADRNTGLYRHLSTVALQVAYWHKRLSQALLRTKERAA